MGAGISLAGSGAGDSVEPSKAGDGAPVESRSTGVGDGVAPTPPAEAAATEPAPSGSIANVTQQGEEDAHAEKDTQGLRRLGARSFKPHVPAVERGKHNSSS